jgi:hypothetical protein
VLALPRAGRPEQRAAGDRGDRGHERHAGEQHHEDRDRDRGAEDPELAELGEPERGERDDDDERGRRDDRAHRAGGGCGGRATVLTGAQALAEAEQQEQEVVDADADEDHGDELGRPRVEIEPEHERGEDDEPCRGARHEVDRDERDDRGQRPAEEQQAQDDDRSEEQRLREQPRALGGIGLVGERRDAAREPHAQPAAADAVGGLVADLAEVLLGDRVAAVGPPLQADELEATVGREGTGLGGDDAARAMAQVAGLPVQRGAAGVDAPARHARGERADRGAVGGGQRGAVGALDERSDGAGALLLPERGLGVPDRLRGLGALGQELRGVVGDDLVPVDPGDRGEGDRHDGPQRDEELGVPRGEGDDGLEHREPPWLCWRGDSTHRGSDCS